MDQNSAKLTILLAVLFCLNICVEGASLVRDDTSQGQGQGLCNENLSSFLPLPYSNLPDMVCKPVWNSYLLRYSKSRTNEITIVLSTIYTTGWVGMGFSKDGMMLNASCMVGWINLEGRARIRQYHIKGFTPQEIMPGEGELPLTSVPPFVGVQGARIYLAFQVKYNRTLKNQPVLLAFSTKYPHHLRLTHHDDKTTINFDFSSGNAVSSFPSPSSIIRNKKTHGVLSLLGWGLFLPCGAVFARYLKHKDPLWYYLHVVIQFTGFLFGVAAVVVGLTLDHRMHASIPAHKGIGIFILTLAVLQVSAFFYRPGKDSKYRRYWKWSHNWLGRICLFFGTLNIVLGIHVGGAGKAWKIGYGFLLGSIMLVCIVFEVLLRTKKLDEPDIPSTFPISSL